MSATAADTGRKDGSAELLLRHCLALGGTSHDPKSPKMRLEEAIGPELARRLLSSITVARRP